MALPKQRRDMGYFDVTGAASKLSADCFMVIFHGDTVHNQLDMIFGYVIYGFEIYEVAIK